VPIVLFLFEIFHKNRMNGTFHLITSLKTENSFDSIASQSIFFLSKINQAFTSKAELLREYVS